MLTELDIINAMLASTGTAPLTSNDTQHPSYVKARNKLTLVNQEVQGIGWWFNKGTRTLIPNADGELVLPSTTLHADPVSRADKVTIRGTRMYDLHEASYELHRSIVIYFVDLVPYTDLPPTAGGYIRSRAVYEFYIDEDGNQPKLDKYLRARDEAWIAFKGENLKNADVNFYDGASFALLQRGVRSRRLPVTTS